MAAAIRSSIRFILNDRPVDLTDVAPDATLLDFLRLDRRLTGTKEGCAEGDCGACTVLVGTPGSGGAMRYETVNACIRFVGSLDCTHVVTIEHLAGPGGVLNPVQQAMVDFHGSQCGFCTPGIVMSLYALWLTTPKPNVAQIEQSLQGNLCRCTGYEPIIKAALSLGDAPLSPETDKLLATGAEIAAKLEEMRDGSRVEIETAGGKLIVPADTDDLAAAYEQYPDATIVAGSTDVGLWVTKMMRDISPVIFIGNIAGLQNVDVSESGITFGAGVSYSESLASIAAKIPALGPLWNRIGGEQVRNMGTIGGNIANGSPIGDTPPPLIALGSTLTLRKGGTRRTMPLEEFFIAYGKQDREPGEFVESVHVPLPAEGEQFAVYKISKRRDEDITATLGAFRLAIDNGTVTSAHIVFGGMAATPKRASAVEAALVGKPWTKETVEAARPAFEEDFQPLSDWRASADYRMLTAKNLLTRFFLESSGETAQIRRHELVEA